MKRLKIILNVNKDTDNSYLQSNEVIYKNISIGNVSTNVLGYIDNNKNFHPYKNDYGALLLLNNIIDDIQNKFDNKYIEGDSNVK